VLVRDDGAKNRFAVLGFGKLGARELNYSSDVDLVFVHETDAGMSAGGPRGSVPPPAFFTRVAERTTKLLAEITADGFVFRVDRRTLDYPMVADLEAMKARVEEQERGKGRDQRNVKLGAGGIREVEFLAQSFAMVHGGKERRLRERSTLGLLRVLVDLGHLPAADGAALADAYVWLRRVEHALQIDEDRQV